MKILLFTDSDAFAGTEQHIGTLAIALVHLGVDVIVASPEGSPLSEFCKSRNLTTYSIEKKGILDLPAIRQITRLVQTKKIDILHVHNGRTALIASVVKQYLPTLKVVFTQHFISPSSVLRSGLLACLSLRLHSYVSSKIDYVICVSSSVRKALESRADGYSRRPHCLILNGIDVTSVELPDKAMVSALRKQLHVPDDTKIILSASRLESEKSVDVLIEAFSKISKEIRSVLLIAGSGSAEQSLRTVSRSLQLDSRVWFLGYRSDISSLMSLSDLFVIASPAEPFGMTVLESMLVSTPVVAANSGGPSEIIEHGKTGYLFEPGNIESLAATMIEALSDSNVDRIINIGKQNVINSYSSVRMATEVVQIYLSCLSCRHIK